jgi:hypothetical protein
MGAIVGVVTGTLLRRGRSRSAARRPPAGGDVRAA